MPRVAAATPEDWAIAFAAWQGGESWAGASKAIGGRAAASTIRRRAIAAGWTRDGEAAAPSIERRRAMTEAAAAESARRWISEKDRIVDRLIGLADTLIDEVTAPHEMIDIKVLGGGKDEPATVETVRTMIPSPVPADKQRLVTSAAIVLDKILVVSGEATARTETVGVERDALVVRSKQLRDQLSERRRAKEIQDDQPATG